MSSYSQIEHLFAEYFAGTLDQAGMESLEHWLLEDDRRVDLLVHYAAVEQGMVVVSRQKVTTSLMRALPERAWGDEDEGRGQSQAQGDGAVVPGLCDTIGPDHDFAETPCDMAISPRAELDVSAGAAGTLPRPYRFQGAIAWIGVAAVVALAAGLWLWAQGGGGDGENRYDATDPLALEEAPVQPPAPQAQEPIAVMADMRRAHWAPGRLNPASDRSVGPGRYELASGAVLIRLSQGATVLVKAPCDFEVIDSNQMALHRGTIVARVPESAAGFAIRVDQVRIIDMGTEFGVEVKSDGAIVTAVFEGEVLMSSHEDMPGVSLVAGQASFADASGVLHPPQDIESLRGEVAFDRTLNRAARTAEERYGDRVLANQPLVYWPFEPDVTGHIGTMFGLSDPKTMYIAGEAIAEEDGAVGYAFRIDEPCHLHFDRPDGFEELTRNFTMMAWVWLEEGGDLQARILDNIKYEDRRLDSSGISFGVARVTPQDDYRPSLTLASVAEYVGDLALPMRQWVHLAVAVDPIGTPTFYVDGQAVETRVVSSEVGGPWVAGPAIASDSDVWIGQGHGMVGRESEHFIGRIDEVAVFDYCVDPERIALFAKPIIESRGTTKNMNSDDLSSLQQ